MNGINYVTAYFFDFILIFEFLLYNEFKYLHFLW